MEDQEDGLEEDEGQPAEELVKVENSTLPEADEKDGVIALMKKRKNEILASFSASCGAFAIGTIIGWTSPALPKLTFNDEEQSWIGSTLAIGGALTTFHTGFLLDNLGRRTTILIQIVPFTTGWLLLAFGNAQAATMYAGRLFHGFACGSASMTAPVYIAEISSPDVRGSLATLFQLMLTIGILYVYLCGKFLSVRLLCVACLVWPCINTATMILLPESPFFLAKKKRFDAAAKAILWFRPHGDPEQEFRDMQESLDVKPLSFIRVMQTKSGRKATVTVLLLMFFQQVSGINVVMFYSEHLFALSKTDLSAEDAVIVLGVVQCAVTVVTALIVDKTGRRLLLLVSFVGMALCQFVLASYFQTLYHEKKATWLPLVCIYAYLISFAAGAGPIPWTMLGELLPTAAKGSVSSAAVFTNWMMAFVVTKTFYTMQNSVEIATPFWFYGVCCALGSILIFLWVPETKGKTLEQIQKEFEGGRIE